MPDREKVIKELEILRDICNAKSNMAIGNGKIAWAGYANSADDALSLLKEQEPRVLTIEEITGDGECWFEGINGACGYADCYMCTGSKEVELHRISMKPEYVSWDDFGKKWRCWSYRPTEEQRKAVKWDDVIERLDAQPPVGGWIRDKDRMDGKKCDEICKYAPPEKKWPCIDCDMRVHDRAEPPKEDSDVVSYLDKH